MTTPTADVDVLCVGHASYDLVFSVPRHPLPDEKIFADGFIGCGGGPAANAAILVSRLGFTAAFAGYLGQDLYGDMHSQEFVQAGVDTRLIVLGASPTPISTVLVKPDGKRALVNYKGDTKPLPSGSVDFTRIKPGVILFDGHEPHISLPLAKHARRAGNDVDGTSEGSLLAKHARRAGIATVLDAGSLHQGTSALLDHVDYLVCSQKFAHQYASDEQTALRQLSEVAPTVVITLGEAGLIWRRGQEQGTLPAYPVTAIDTTGAGDAFHGAFAAALSAGMDWPELLRYASAAGALCCTKTGAREGLPWKQEHQALFAQSLPAA